MVINIAQVKIDKSQFWFYDSRQMIKLFLMLLILLFLISFCLSGITCQPSPSWQILKLAN